MYADEFIGKAARGGYRIHPKWVEQNLETYLWDRRIWIAVAQAEGWRSWHDKVVLYLDLRLQDLSVEHALKVILHEHA